MSELNNPAPQLSLNTPMDEPAAEAAPVQSIQQQELNLHHEPSLEGSLGNMEFSFAGSVVTKFHREK